MNHPWDEVPLSAVCSVLPGFAFKSTDWSDTGTTVIRIGDIHSDRTVAVVGATKVATSLPLTPQLRRFTLRDGDIVLAMTGATAGKVGKLRLSEPALLNQRVAKLTPTSVDANYFWALISSAEYEKRLFRLADGAAQPNMSASQIERLMLPNPPATVQRGIGRVMCAYDDLIEVNRRRVTILEEMARRLFEEWFVHLRFPGHESVPVHDTPNGPLPERWEWSCLARACVRREGIQTGPFGSQLHQTDYAAVGVPVVMPKNLLDLRISASNIARIPEKLADTLGRHRMRTGDVAYGRRGDIGRRAYISPREDGWFCGTGCLRLRPDKSVTNPRYFFDALGMTTTFDAIKARAQGATMPNLSAGVMAEVPLLLPPLTLQELYGSRAEPLTQLASALLEVNTSLAAARDLLLPRLVTGELSLADTPLPDRLLDAAD